MMEKERGSIKCEIVRQIGVLNTYPTGWSKEFNLVRWNDRSEKYDIRDWAPGHERMSRGVTMHADELEKLMGFCEGLFSDSQKTEEMKTHIEMTAAKEQDSGGTDSVQTDLAGQPAEEVPF